MRDNENQESNNPADATERAAAPLPETIQGIEPPKKRRGRPPKNPIPETGIPGEEKKPTEKPKRRGKFDAESTARLAKQLQGIHMMAAQVTQLGELMISDQESAMLADALVNISAEYGLELSGKTGATIQLLGTAAMIYLPRFHVISQKVKTAKANRESSQVLENVAPVQ